MSPRHDSWFTRMNGLEWWLGYAAIGAVVGVLAGMLGIGGGAIMVPLLASLLEAQGIPRSQILHLTVGTSMATILFTSVSSVRAHHVRGAVRWRVLKQITPGILAGGLAGSLAAGFVSTRGLAIFFALLVYAVGTNTLLDQKPRATRDLPGPVGMFAVGAAISGLSSLMAIGGAAMTIPFMVFCNVPPIQAVVPLPRSVSRSRLPAASATWRAGSPREACRQRVWAMSTCRRWRGFP